MGTRLLGVAMDLVGWESFRRILTEKHRFEQSFSRNLPYFTILRHTPWKEMSGSRGFPFATEGICLV